MSVTSRDYHAFMSCTGQSGWLEPAQQQLGEWLREKNLDVDLASDELLEVDNRMLRLRHHQDSHSRSLRAQLVETATAWGTWTTDLILHERRGVDGWVSISVENDQNNFVDTPRVARYLMQTVPLGDGRVRFADQAQVFKIDDAARLVELLRDQERHGLVFAAGTTDHDLPFEPFVKRMDFWTRQVYGLGQVVVLAPPATKVFNSTVAPEYRAATWGIRTFYPGVDLESPWTGGVIEFWDPRALVPWTTDARLDRSKARPYSGAPNRTRPNDPQVRPPGELGSTHRD